MSSVDVTFDLPPEIASGLATGEYTRTGGVVQHTASGQIAAWLRESGTAAEDPEAHSGLLNSLLHRAGLKANTVGIFAARSAPIIGFALNGYLSMRTERRMYQRIRELIRAEFRLQRIAEIQAAEESYAAAHKAEKTENVRVFAQDALSALLKAPTLLSTEIDDLQNKQRLSERSMLEVLSYHVLLMDVYANIAGCYLLLGEESLAQEKLASYSEEHLLRFRGYLNRRIDSGKLAKLAYSNLPRGSRKSSSIKGTAKRLEVLVANFGDDAATSEIIKHWRDASDRVRELHPSRKRISRAVDQADIAIENYQRLNGMVLELSALQRLSLSYSESQDIETGAKDMDEEYYMMVDRDVISAANRIRR